MKRLEFIAGYRQCSYADNWGNEYEAAGVWMPLIASGLILYNTIPLLMSVTAEIADVAPVKGNSDQSTDAVKLNGLRNVLYEKLDLNSMMNCILR